MKHHYRKAINWLMCLALAVPLLLLTQQQKAAAFSAAVSTDGAMQASLSENYRNVYKEWSPTGGERISKAHITFTGRSYFPSYSNNTYDYMYLYYKSCATCGWSSWGQYGSWSTKSVDTWVDFGSTAVYGVRILLYNNYASPSSQTSTGDVPEVEMEVPPYDTGTPWHGQATSTNGTMRFQTNSNYATTYRTFTAPSGKTIDKAHFVFTPGSANCDDAYLMYYVPSRGWYYAFSQSNVPSAIDQWFTFDHGAATQIQAMYDKDCSSTPDMIGDVPEVIFSGNSEFPADMGYYQTVISWGQGRNPNGVTYELWRKAFQNGVEYDNQLIYSGNEAQFATTDQVAGRYYLYRVVVKYGGNSVTSGELPYHTAPVPYVSETGTRQLVVSWSSPANVQNRVLLRQNDGSWNAVASPPAGANSQTLTGLDPGSSYEVALEPVLTAGGRAFRTGAGSHFVPIWEAPGGFSFSSATSSINVSWSNGTLPASGVAYRLFQNGSLIYEGVNRNYAATGLNPVTSYSYQVCALNKAGVCGPMTPAAQFKTAPVTPDTPTVQYGSSTWGPDARGWAEVTWNPVPGAYGYKLYNIPTGSPIDMGTATSKVFTDLAPGATFTPRVSAYTDGESAQSGWPTLTTPDRRDGTAPNVNKVLINNGALSTAGNRVQVQVETADNVSPYELELSNDNKIWSTVKPAQDAAAVNLIELAGGNPIFTDLAGWQPDFGSIWTGIAPENTAMGGKIVSIRNDGSGTCCAGLHLAKSFPVEEGQQYTVRMSYKLNGLTTGNAYVFSHWLDANGNDVAGGYSVFSADRQLTDKSGNWAEFNDTLTAPPGAKSRSIWIGFSDYATSGATISVDYIVASKGTVAVHQSAVVPKTSSVAVPWDIAPSNNQATVYARVKDLAGNVSAAGSATIKVSMGADMAPPKVAVLVNGGAETTSSRNVALTVTAQDDQTPTLNLLMRLSNDGTFWGPWEPYTPQKPWELPMSPGRKTVWVEVKDAANNTGTGMAQIFLVASDVPVTQPAILWVEGGQAGKFNTGAEVWDVQFLRVGELKAKFDISRLAGVKQVRFAFDANLAGARWESLAGERTFTLPPWEGVKTLYAQLDDGRTFQQRIVLDTQAPDVQIAWSGGATIAGPDGRATLVIQAQDNLARTEDLQVSINGGAWQTLQTEMVVTLSGAGPKTVVARVRDRAGNEATKTLGIFVQ